MPHKSTSGSLSDDALGLERIEFFSDAVMAIAITLLALDLRFPDLPPGAPAAELPARLAEMAPRVVGFVISFAVVGVYWSSHHRYFRHIRRYDNRLLVLNLVFLLLIALMPSVASLLGRYPDVPLAIMIYSGAVGATGLAIGAVWWYASHNHRLVDETVDRALIRRRNLVALLVPLVFIASIPIAAIDVRLTFGLWFIGPFLAIFLARGWERRRVRRKG